MRRRNDNREALEFEWDPEDSKRYLTRGDNPHVHPKMAELVKRWYLAGDGPDDIDRKARNAARRLFRGKNSPQLAPPPRRHRHDNRRNDDRNNNRRGRNQS